MKKILLINSPIRLVTNPSIFPIGLGIIAAILEKKGYQVNILDINAYRYTKQQVCEKLLDYKDVDVVGISGLVTTYGFQKWISAQIKSIIPNAIIIFGGGCVTSIPEIVFEHCKVDFAVLQEGEEAIVELIDALAEKGDIGQVKGIAFREDGKCVITSRRNLIRNLDNIPFSAYDKFPMEIYIRNLSEELRGYNRNFRSMSILCSRGCPFNCNFCFHFFGGPSYRVRSVNNILEELDFLKDKFGIKFFSLIDENLMVNRDYLMQLCSELKKRKIIWECWGRVDSADERLRTMAESGCVRISYGAESGSQKILDNMNKRLTPDLISRAVKNTRRFGIAVETTWIYGYPGENRQTLRDTYLLKKKLKLRPGGFFINPYPGTVLYDECLKKGTIKNEEEFVLKLDDANKAVINLTDLEDEEFMRLVHYFERKLLINNCLRYPRHLFQAVKYKIDKIRKANEYSNKA